MSNLIQLRNVRKVYRMGEEKIVALDDINLDFEKGKIYCLLGTSGSGKSTLLNMMACLEKPTKGSIVFKNVHLENLSERDIVDFRRKYIGFVFQSYNLLPSLTALENVMLPLILQNTPRAARKKRAAEMLKSVGLGERMKHRPSEMSGGQQQRVSIARALINNPELIFADEPTGNLDTKTTIEMMELITKIVSEHNQTLIIVTHDLEISEYADCIIHVRDGLISSVEEKTRSDSNAQH